MAASVLSSSQDKDIMDTTEDSNSSCKPAKRRRAGSRDSNKSSDIGDDVIRTDSESFFPAESLYEYHWPQNSKDGEMYMLQEQVSEFLVVKSFKRKYPDLDRRELDMKERNFLREKGAVTEMQVNLGLTALKTDEVLDLMAKDYPDKYKEYAAVLQERERQSIKDKHKEYEVPAVDAGKIKEYIKKAVKQASEYNMLFNRDRKEERQAYYDMQTSIAQVPKGSMFVMPKEATKVQSYPVALLPGQFQNHYKKYTAAELNYFPLNTALYGPPLSPSQLPSTIDDDESDESSIVGDQSVSESSDGSGSSSDSDSGSSSESESSSAASKTNGKRPSKGYKPKNIPDAICGICLKDKKSNKKGMAEDLVHCSQCDNSGHPSCLEMSSDLVRVIQTYPWQCMECKTCTHCGDPTHEDKMMFCDDCDRGYHTFCVGLKSIPTGKWSCESCRVNSDTQSNNSTTTDTPTTARTGRTRMRRRQVEVQKKEQRKIIC